MALSTRTKADLVLLAATTGWAVTFAVVKGALEDASPAAFLTARFIIGALAALFLAGRSITDRASLKYGAILGVILWLGFVFNTFGLQYTSATRSGFVTDLCVVLVPIFGAVLFRQRIHTAAWVAAVVAAAGLLVMSAPSFAEAEGGSSLLGDLLTVGSALVYAFHILYTGRFAQRVKPGAAVFAQLAVVAVLSAAMLPFEQVRFHPTPSLIGTLLFTGICASAFFIYMQLWAQARTTAVRASLIFTLEPVLAAVFSRIILGETLVAATLQGGALIVSAILVSELWPWLEARRSPGATPTTSD